MNETPKQHDQTQMSDVVYTLGGDQVDGDVFVAEYLGTYANPDMWLAQKNQTVDGGFTDADQQELWRRILECTRLVSAEEDLAVQLYYQRDEHGFLFKADRLDPVSHTLRHVADQLAAAGFTVKKGKRCGQPHYPERVKELVRKGLTMKLAEFVGDRHSGEATLYVIGQYVERLMKFRGFAR